ncbi:MAG: hypothetical protein F4118_10370 [Acidimicrobiaceae bacterium]|nr:hypothetical protein [Acidimicrobiaceae bacterium]
MGITAGGYILIVPPARRDLLLAEAKRGPSFIRSMPLVAEPVPKFIHSRRAPLAVFCSFESDQITHIAEGKRGVMAGTGLVRLNMHDLTELSRPIGFVELLTGIGMRVRPHLQRILAGGGILPPKTLQAFVDRIVELDETAADRLAHFSAQRRDALSRLAPNEKLNLALQKESVGIALEISGISRDDLVTWRPKNDSPRSFIEGLPSAVVREDAMLFNDFSTLPGFDAIDEGTHFGAKVFKHSDDPSIRMTVIMANRLPLEQQTGADLIYYNEAYRCFVMVQYKAMHRGIDEPEFRWQEGDQFMKEVARMERLLAKLKAISSGNDPDGFRFSENPFFLKFCPRILFNPDDRGLFKGIYLPLDLWKRLNAAEKLRGKRGGNVLTYRNVGRRINNSEFVRLVGGSWVGTSIEQSAVLSEIIREVLASGKTVTFAVKEVVSDEELY